MSDITGMVPSNPTDTQVEAALAMLPSVHEIQSRVLLALANHGPMTDEELANCPELSRWKATTVRVRRIELRDMGRVQGIGKRKNQGGRMMIVWGLTPPGTLPAPRHAPEPGPSMADLLACVHAGTLSIEAFGRACYRLGFQAGKAKRLQEVG